ncbi:sulfotransferase [Synechococcus sp. BSF8S]|nr:sulfotransferase [Synechococcus sp. BSF8S]MBC1265406.1 sulfotransferase [Synechococcus sp. BSA11S]
MDNKKLTVQFEGGTHQAYSPIIPRFWYGMTLPVLIGLLFRNRLRVSCSRFHLLITSLIISFITSIAALLTAIIFRRQLRCAQLHDAPIFIIGHWRTGTTYLHELMMLDNSLCTPNSLQCFAPSCFPLIDRFFYKYMNWLMPATRYFDQVSMGWTRPQEDEFALLALGAPSPYLRIAFPHTARQRDASIDFKEYSIKVANLWIKKLELFLSLLYIRDQRRPVLKSPTHTARIGVLNKMFPGAKFIHIVRDPRAFVPSTKRLWQSLYTFHSFQVGPFNWLEELVFSQYNDMYSCFNRDQNVLSANQLCEIKYENLVSDPVTVMRYVYQKLGLSDADAYDTKLRAYLSSLPPYKANEFAPAAPLLSRIENECADYIQKYGY